MVALAFWDSAVASLAYLLLIPLLALLVSPLFLLAYVIDAPVVLIPVLVGAYRRGELGRALVSFPSYFPLRVLNGVMMLNALVRECVSEDRFSSTRKVTDVAGLPALGCPERSSSSRRC